MSTLAPVLSINNRLSYRPGCNRILLQLREFRNRVSNCGNSNEKILNLFTARVNSYKMNHYSTERVLTLDNMNPAVLKMEYAVRGPLVIRAAEIQKELLEKVNEKFHFSYLKNCLILPNYNTDELMIH